MRKGQVVPNIRDIHGNLHKGRFVVVGITSALSGPSYFVEVHPEGKPDVTFAGRVFTRWLEEEKE